jgi:ATP synthase protein I
MKNDAEKKTGIVKSVAPYLNLGFEFALAILIGLALGYFVDSKLSTRPVFLLIGLLLGAIAGFLTVYRAVYPQSFDRQEKTTRSNEFKK